MRTTRLNRLAYERLGQGAGPRPGTGGRASSYPRRRHVGANARVQPGKDAARPASARATPAAVAQRLPPRPQWEAPRTCPTVTFGRGVPVQGG